MYIILLIISALNINAMSSDCTLEVAETSNNSTNNKNEVPEITQNAILMGGIHNSIVFFL